MVGTLGARVVLRVGLVDVEYTVVVLVGVVVLVVVVVVEPTKTCCFIDFLHKPIKTLGFRYDEYISQIKGREMDSWAAQLLGPRKLVPRVFGGCVSRVRLGAFGVQE